MNYGTTIYYSLIKYKNDVKENINVGMIFHIPEQVMIEFDQIKNLDKLKLFNKNFNKKSFKQKLNKIEVKANLFRKNNINLVGDNDYLNCLAEKLNQDDNQIYLTKPKMIINAYLEDDKMTELNKKYLNN